MAPPPAVPVDKEPITDEMDAGAAIGGVLSSAADVAVADGVAPASASPAGAVQDDGSDGFAEAAAPTVAAMDASEGAPASATEAALAEALLPPSPEAEMAKAGAAGAVEDYGSLGFAEAVAPTVTAMDASEGAPASATEAALPPPPEAAAEAGVARSSRDAEVQTDAVEESSPMVRMPGARSLACAHALPVLACAHGVM